MAIDNQDMLPRFTSTTDRRESPLGKHTIGAVNVAVLLAVQLAGWLSGWLVDWFSCSQCSNQYRKVSHIFFSMGWRAEVFTQAKPNARNILNHACFACMHMQKGSVFICPCVNDQDTEVSSGHSNSRRIRQEADKRYENDWSPLSRAHLSITEVKTSYLVPQSISSSLYWACTHLKNPDARWE